MMYGCGVAVTTHVVGMVVVWVVVRTGVTPAGLVNVIVVGVKESGCVWVAHIRIVGRHGPEECGRAVRMTETERRGRIVHARSCAIKKPYAPEVDRHIDFVSGVSIPSINPNLVVLRVDSLCPYFVKKDVSLDFVIISAINHNFLLGVEITDGPLGLTIGKIVNRISPNRHGKC